MLIDVKAESHTYKHEDDSCSDEDRSSLHDESERVNWLMRHQSSMHSSQYIASVRSMQARVLSET
nr:MAG TPA: hypothetical protein [Herelleviridae sp.]